MCCCVGMAVHTFGRLQSVLHYNKKYYRKNIKIDHPFPQNICSESLIDLTIQLGENIFAFV